MLIGARELLTQIGDGAQQLTAAARTADVGANAERLLRGLTLRLEVGTDSLQRFSGEEREAQFASWCDVPSGWQERCEVRIAFDTIDADLALVLARHDGSRIPVRTGLARGKLLYLKSAADAGVWYRSWGTGVTAPLAIGAVCERNAQVDTLVLRIGARG